MTITKTNSLRLAAALVGVTILLGYLNTSVAFAASSLFGGATMAASEVTLVSNTGDADPNNDYSGVSFDDVVGQPFSSLATLSSSYNVTDDDCGAGSPRFQVRIDENNNGIDDASDGNIFVYMGPSPSFTNCAAGWQSTGNLIGNNDAGRWSSEQITGGVNSGTYAQALAAAGALNILDINIVVDSGWNSDAANGDSEQTNLIDNVTINNAVYGFEAQEEEDVTVSIHKYVDGEQANSTTAEGQSFPMQSSWSNAGFPDSANASYSLAPSTYSTETSPMDQGANYSTNEMTDTSVVGPNCENEQLFKLVGYSWGESVEAAEAMTPSTSSPSFTDLETNKHVIVWNEDCSSDFVNVNIIKYIDGTHATSGSANSAEFPFTATYNASNIGAGSDPFSIGQVGNNTPNAYEAMTIDLASGADYKAEENTSGNEVVGATCEDGKPFALQGYQSGNTLLEAQNASTSTTAPAFIGLTSDKYVITKNVTCEPEDVTVTIVKNIDGVHATAVSAHNASFPMQSSWDDANNGGVGNGAYALSTTGFNSQNAYEAVTTDMANGSDYTTNEDTSTSVVGLTCTNGKDYKLVGYTTGSTLQAAQAASPTQTVPAFTNITTDQYVIVWNEECDDEPEPPVNVANACEMPTVAPAGYTLRNGTSGNDNVTLAPNTMFVGKGGNDKVKGANGNYIVCTGSGNDIIKLGNGDSTIDTGGGNNKVTTGNGTGTVKGGSGNDVVTVGNGTHTIDAGGGNNAIETGNGDQNVTALNGNDKITTGNGNDTIKAGGGNNKVKSMGGNDSVTSQNGNDNIDGGGGSADMCNAGGGNNTITNCEL